MNAPVTGANDPFAAAKVGYQTTIAGIAATQGASAAVQATHATEAPFCTAVARGFFAEFRYMRITNRTATVLGLALGLAAALGTGAARADNDVGAGDHPNTVRAGSVRRRPSTCTPMTSPARTRRRA